MRLEFTKGKIFYAANDFIKKNEKTKTTKQEKIFPNPVSDGVMYPEYIKNL